MKEEGSPNIIKRWLTQINTRFSERQAALRFQINPQNHKIDRQLGVVKNFMRLTNKTLIGIQRASLNPTALLVGLFGMFCGFVYAKTDETLQMIRLNYRPAIKQAIIISVLRNQGIKDKLNQTLLANVYTNPDIQYKLHELLITKAIRPQERDLFELSKTAIIQALEGEYVRGVVAKVAAKAMYQNREIIARFTLQFLGSDTMDRLLKEKVVKQLQEEEVSEGVAKALKDFVQKQLMAEGNRESLYSAVRTRFMSW